MRCREAFMLIANHEQDNDLPYYLQTESGQRAESHASNCRCSICWRSIQRIQSTGVRGRLRVIPSARSAA